MKHCNTCNTTKPFSEFYSNPRAGDGKATQCKACEIEASRRYRRKNLEACRKREREYSAKNSEKRNEKVKAFLERNPGKKHEYQKRYYSKPEAQEKRRKWAREYARKKRSECEVYRMKMVCRSRLHIALRRMGGKKTTRTFKTIGCSPEFLVKYLEQMFDPGMTWENHGEWHVDHIIPICNATSKEEVLKLSHYTNLQPKWAQENWSKGGRFQLEMQASYDT